MNWNENTHFAALDWAREHHDVVVLNQHGVVVDALRFDHTPAGWQEVRILLAKYPGLPVAIETNQGLTVEQLLACEVRVYPINPKSAERYRERHAPSGVKDDYRDAWTMADALRLDGGRWRPLVRLDPRIAELRLLCRDEIALIEQRTALVNQLRSALHDYYPAALEAFTDWTTPATWAFIIAFPTPEALQAAGKRRWTAFLHLHRLWRDTAQHRLDVFGRATALVGSPAAIAAKSLLAITLAQVLTALEKNLNEYRRRIASVFAQHPDHALFGSLPGTGTKIGPRLLGEIGDDRERFPDVEVLQCNAGTAPVTVQSGAKIYQRLRHSCNNTLRATVHHWANLSRQRCSWAEAYYQAHRKKGKSHACAVRCLGQRWLRILWKMWQTRTPYDEALHLRNQIKHGSWLAAEKPASPAW
jgi:transposase